MCTEYARKCGVILHCWKYKTSRDTCSCPVYTCICIGGMYVYTLTLHMYRDNVGVHTYIAYV